MQSVLVTFLVVYLVSAFGVISCNVHTFKSWSRAYRDGKPVSALTLWNPLYSFNWFGNWRPRRLPTNEDRKVGTCLGLIPVLNTAELLFFAGVLVCVLTRRSLISVFFASEENYRRWKAQPIIAPRHR